MMRLIYWKMATVAWFLLMVLTLIWDGVFAPLHTGWALLLMKLLPLCGAFRGIVLRKKYTFQLCSMLVLLYFAEGVVRLFDAVHLSRWFALGEMVLTMWFFVACLLFVRELKK